MHEPLRVGADSPESSEGAPASTCPPLDDPLPELDEPPDEPPLDEPPLLDDPLLELPPLEDPLLDAVPPDDELELLELLDELDDPPLDEPPPDGNDDPPLPEPPFPAPSDPPLEDEGHVAPASSVLALPLVALHAARHSAKAATVVTCRIGDVLQGV